MRVALDAGHGGYDPGAVSIFAGREKDYTLLQSHIARSVLLDFGISKSMNLVHGSDSPESAERELGLFFQSYEIFDWEPADLEWSYDPAEELGR